MTSQISRFGNKFIPQSRTIVQASFTGIGFDQGMKAVDNLIGSPLQKTLSFNLPILGPVGLIDIINYMTHAGGLKVSKKGIAAVGASKFVAGVLPSIGPIQLPTGTSATSSIGSNPSSGAPI
tara:strand:- start:8493 stop:8858 length:366 start_codon:yes stop_codon:yes gene_type:complete